MPGHASGVMKAAELSARAFARPVDRAAIA